MRLFQFTALLSFFAFAGPALLPAAQGVNPPPDGGYANGEHGKLEALQETVAELKSALQEQAGQIRKVSKQLETTKPVSRVVSTE